MKSLPPITEAEYEVMKIVWHYAPISTNEITEKLTQEVTYEKQSRVFVYTPLVKENEYVGQQSKSFLKRFFNGDITAMVSSFLENDRLTEDEIDSLRSLLSKDSPKGGK